MLTDYIHQRTSIFNHIDVHPLLEGCEDMAGEGVTH